MLRTLRGVWAWALLLTMAVVGRDALDWWLAPTDDFYARSVVSTAVAVAIFAGAGMWTASRSRSVRSGALAGLATGVLAAVAIDAIALATLAVRHDPHTMAMIKASGGLDEAFLLPLMVVVPGTICAAAGAAIGKMLASTLRSGFAE
jgi:hypothetical protein